MAVANASMPNQDEKIRENEDTSIEKSDSSVKIMKKKKTISRGKSICHDDGVDIVGNDISQDSIFDDCVFPSPVAITEEEALRETHCHFVKNYHVNNSGSFDDGMEELRGSGFINSRSTLRREMEKPPRLQKQLSRDRLPGGNKQNLAAEGAQTNGGSQTHGSESSNECLDSTGVDVHEFLVKALQSNPRDRNILLKLERDMLKFINTKENVFMRFPEMTSYHRMLVHRVAAYFGMDHNIDAKGKSVIINKTENTRIPEKKFHEYILEADELSNGREEDGRRSILKRMKNCQSLDHAKAPVNHSSSWKDAKQKSYEEREDHYERTRARIFQEGPRNNDRYRYKERILSQWKSHSIDIDSLPSKGSSTPPTSSLAPPSTLTKKAHSYSGMTILSRNSNFKKESISSSSSSSSLYQPQPNDSLQNDVITGDDKHPVHVQPNLYPHPPSTKDFADVSGPKSQTPKSSNTQTTGHVIDFSQKQLVIAVPAGFHIEPGTVLTNPHTGIPYVNLEGQPILHPHGPLSMPFYANVPLHYPSANVIPQEVSPMPQPQEMNGMIQNGVLQPEAHLPPVNVYHPPGPLVYPYQAAPVHLYSYPVHPIPQPKPPASSAELNGHHQNAGSLQTDMANLQLNSTNSQSAKVPHVQGQPSSNGVVIPDKKNAEDGETLDKSSGDVKASPNTTLTCESDNAQQLNGDSSEPQNALQRSPQTNGPSTEKQALTSDNQNIEENRAKETLAAPISQADNHNAQVSNLGGTTVSTRVGGVTYFTPSDAAPPIQTGSSGQALFPAPVHPRPPVYPGGMIPYAYPGVLADGKMYRPILNQQSVPVPVDAQRDYFLQASGPVAPSANFMPHAAPSFYYMINGQAMNQYQGAPMFYSPVGNGYPTQGQPPVGPPPFYDLPNHDTPIAQPVTDGKTVVNGFVDGDLPYPMLVSDCTDTENMQMINFAARHNAKIVQRAKDDVKDSNASDIFLLFPSSSLAFKALEEAKSENFQLSDITDVKQRAELLEQINAAK